MANIAIPRIPQISTTIANVGDLRLDDNVLSTIDYQSTILSISSYIVSSLDQISGISGDVETISSNVSTLICTVQSCELSIDGLSVKLSSVYKDLLELSAKAIFHYVNNVSFLKPVSEHPLNLSISIYDDYSMSSLESRWPADFDSANPDCSSFIEALLINNAENNLSTEETETYPSGQPVYSSFGTQWMKPVYVSGDFGFGVEYNNAPVVVHLYDWLSSNPTTADKASKLTKNSKLYLRSEWYYTTLSNGNTVYHKSDAYSQVVPSNAEQTADKTYFENPAATYVPMQAVTVPYLSVSDWAYEDESFYTIKPDQLNILSNGLDSTHNWLYLDNYSSGAEYKVKFVASSKLSVGNDHDGSSYVHIAANGALLDDFNNTRWTFLSGTTYMVSIQAGMIQVLSRK